MVPSWKPQGKSSRRDAVRDSHLRPAGVCVVFVGCSVCAGCFQAATRYTMFLRLKNRRELGGALVEHQTV